MGKRSTGTMSEQDLVDEIGSNRTAQQKPAAPKPDAKEEPPKKQRSAAWYSMAFFISILTCVLFYETVLLLSVAMAPTGVAYLIDTNPRRHATKTVAWTNLAGALIVTFDLWGSDRTLATTIDLLSDPFNWVFMLGGAGAGWIIHFVVPGIVFRYLTLSLDLRRKSLKDEMEKLEKEWGEDVRGNAPLEELATLEKGPVEENGDENGENYGDDDTEEDEDRPT